MGFVVGLLGLIALLPSLGPCSGVDFGGSEQGDAAVAVVLVLPGHIGTHPGASSLEIVEGAGVARPVFHCAELGFGKRVVIADSRSGIADRRGGIGPRSRHRVPPAADPIAAVSSVTSLLEQPATRLRRHSEPTLVDIDSSRYRQMSQRFWLQVAG